MANRVASVAGNRLVGARAVAAQEHRARLDEVANLFERTIAAAARQAQVSIEISGQRLTRKLALSVVCRGRSVCGAGCHRILGR